MSQTKKIRFSIIVPVYNAGKYIARCLDSLCDQSYQDIEIIVVDDGSSDDTPSILEDYRKNNIKLLRQDNFGVAIARDNGMKMASGDYCMLMDADDWLDNDAIKRINDYIVQFDGVDILKFRFKWEPSGCCSKKYLVHNRIMGKEELRALRKEMLLTGNYNNIWNQVFKKGIYSRVEEGRDRIDYGEDILTNLGMISVAKKVLLVNDVLYHYCKNPSSATHKMSLDIISKNIKDHVLIGKKKNEYLRMFEFENLDENVFKEQVLLFACDQIKKYMLSCNRLRGDDMRRVLEASGIYDYIGNIKIGVKRIDDKMICKVIMNKDFRKLLLIRPVIVMILLTRRIRQKTNVYRIWKKKNNE